MVSVLPCLDLTEALDLADHFSPGNCRFQCFSFDFPGSFSSPLNVGVAESPPLAQHVLFLGDLAHICGFMTHKYFTSSLDFS